jgi:hypothetical protein
LRGTDQTAGLRISTIDRTWYRRYTILNPEYDIYHSYTVNTDGSHEAVYGDDDDTGYWILMAE